MPNVIRSFERPDPDHLKEIAKFPPATLHEAQGRRGAVDSRIKPVARGMSFGGPAMTVSCHIGDNLMVFEAINLAQPGDVLVVSAGNNPEQGGFGEVLASACLARGIAAFVIDAGVRDGAALRELGLPVFSLGLCIKGTTKETVGSINHPIVLGGEWIRPGDFVAGDDDGVVVVRKEEIIEVARASAAREADETRRIASYRAGTPMDISKRVAVMREKGCTWDD
ncbi:MAG: 4-carboxy-4-hydroxy-2-oxoadipate aldolase/oxaloacetate decarboxylase [Rhodospirillales bacterium]|nr:4-carboxy-4-hydroxy-2-oxoadipate aldolase/oxaloacetate decarboxylase [Rhodospirillales bacterium]